LHCISRSDATYEYVPNASVVLTLSNFSLCSSKHRAYAPHSAR